MGKKVPGSDQIISQNLIDFQGVHIWISQVDSNLEADGLDLDFLWLAVRKRFSQAGLPVPQQFYRRQTPMFPCLGILIHTDLVQIYPPFYIFSTEVFFVQKITLAEASPANTMHMTWCRESIGEIRRNPRGFDWANLYSAVDCLVKQFLREGF
jgi:hypothetical protein